ncbi:DNA-binding bromodomain-containing protein [Actinidia rufa]|uniref:DNA-binding bromodomain-containing protein n=1 Tax=Actinidia rufa TaxID=165716 RepID=A0A7J0G9S0_9ERIC|nr:DNA-binding bromodomain-containing protein [Actinidia rufa]
MASGTLGGEETRERNRWGENNKVYTRKKGLKTTTATSNANAANNDTAVAATFTATTANNENNNNDNNVVPQQSLQALATEDLNSSQKQLDVESDDSSNHDRLPQVDAPNGCEPPQVDVPNGFELPNENGDIRPIIVKVDNRVRINLAEGRSKNEIRELKRKLVSELDEVRSLAKRLEAKEIQLTSDSIAAAAGGGYSHSQYSANDGRALMRVNSEVGSVSHHDSRLFRKLSVSVVENNYGIGDLVEKEKRTPKANQYYRNSEFLLGKDRLPPAESNKKLKSNGGKKHGREMGYGFGLSKSISKIFKRCNNLLSRLMKHKHAWGQDVHVMAEELSMIFEEKWAVIESEYCLDWRFELVHDVGLPTPTSRKVQPPRLTLPPSAFEMRTLERAESMIMAADSRLKLNAPVGRTPVPKKPKAKDPNKRDMTYEEKQRLSTHLQKTLWELDRFVTNYKKILSKNKRKAELALQARAEATTAVPATNPGSAVVEAPKESKADENNVATSPAQGERQRDNVSGSSSSSSSSSDSDSTSSDSDSDSSSANGSDAGHSPGT